MSSYRVHLRPQIFEKDFDLAILRKDGAMESILINLDFAPYMPGFRSDPLHVDRELLQALLDEMWKIGLRPVGYADTRDKFDATSRHLEDFRTIAFAQLKLAKP